MPVRVIDTIKPNGIPVGQSQFPTVEDIDILGGFQIQANAAARLAIPLVNQKIGMLVYQLDNSTYYNLTATGSPGTWSIATFSSGFTAGGDLSGTSSAQIVSKIQGITISGSPSANQVLGATSSSAATWISLPNSLPPSGTASGDLSGFYPSPTVSRLNGIVITGTPSNGQVLQANSSSAASWQTFSGGFTAGSDLSGTSTNQTVIKIQGNSVKSQTLSSTQDGYVLTWVNANNEYEAKPQAGGGFIAGGDLSGTSSNQTIVKIGGNPIATQTLGIAQDGYALTWDFIDGYYHAAPSGGGGGSPSGSAGGNLTGSYPNPLVIGATPLFIANLFTTSPVGTRNVIFLDGYSSQNDGGGGTFVWTPGTFNSDGGTIVVPTGFATIGAWVRSITDGIFSVRYFGAKSDGSDCTQAVQTCVNAACIANSAGFATVYFPSDHVSGMTVYTSASAPIFLEGAVRITMDSSTQYQVSGHLYPAFINSLAGTTGTPTYGIESGIPYINLTPAVGTVTANSYSLSMYPTSVNFQTWGNGVRTQLTQSFIQAGVGTVVSNVSVVDGYVFGVVGAEDQTYILGAGNYLVQVVDATHVNLTLRGHVSANEFTTGQTIPNGSPLGGNSAVAGPGFTFDCLIDPIINWPVGQANGYIASSAGQIGGGSGYHSCFNFYLYNDQGTAQTRVGCNLRTAGTDPGTPLLSGSTTIPAGSMTHLAVTYDGYSTVSLYVAGNRVATQTQTGLVNQQWWEAVYIGILPTAFNTHYPNMVAPSGDSIQQTVKLGPCRFNDQALYLGGISFSPPTSLPYPSGSIGLSIDWSQRPSTLIGPGNLDYSAGWIIATGFLGIGVPCWILSNSVGAALSFNYCGGVQLEKCNIVSSASCLYTLAAIYGIIRDCILTGSQQVITLDGFSYNWHIENNQVNVGINSSGYCWGYGILFGSQFTNIDGSFIFGGGWLIATNVFAGVIIKNLYCEGQGLGGIIASSDGSAPSLHIEDCFNQNDSGLASFNGIAAYYITGVRNVKITGGYFQSTNIPCIIDNCGVVEIETAQTAYNIQSGAPTSGNALPYFQITNQTTPITYNGLAAFNPDVVPFHWGVTNGSTTVSAINNGVLSNTAAGVTATFASQPNTTYLIIACDQTTGNLTLNLPYSGVTNSATILTAQNLWMPQSGTGQGPLIIEYQEDFGINTVNMIAAGGMTMNINDFLWKVINFTDVDRLLSGTVKVTLPLIAGYTRSFINSTLQTLTLGGTTGATVSVTAGSKVTASCDGVNWL